MINRLKQAVQFADALNRTVGQVSAWLIVGMTLATFATVVLRYVFGLGWIWLQETVLYMHGSLLMIAAGYTLLAGGHVRVDIFYRDWSEERKARVDIIGAIFLLLPVCLLILIKGLPYVFDSFGTLEGSPQPGGLPILFLFKAILILMPLLLLLQGFSQAARSYLFLKGEMSRLAEDDTSSTHD